MNCEQVSACLDLLMDGELNDDMRRELDAHGQNCPACAKAIRDTLQLKALLSEMEPEVAVPLSAQAAWRGAVREEAARSKKRRLTRWIGSAAATAALSAAAYCATAPLNASSSPSGRSTAAAVSTTVCSPTPAAA